jgi:hypothetical protein
MVPLGMFSGKSQKLFFGLGTDFRGAVHAGVTATQHLGHCSLSSYAAE